MAVTVPHPNPQETVRPDIEAEFNGARAEIQEQYITDRIALEETFRADLEANRLARKTALRSAGLNSDGSTPLGYYASTVVLAHNTVAPTISGEPTVGEILTVDEGTWTGDPTFTYQWILADADESNELEIVDGTEATYLIDEDEEGMILRVVVKGVNADGQDTATSEFTEVIAAEED